MKKFYYLLFSICMLLSFQVQAQRVVDVETNNATPTNLSEVINGDTTETGERMDNNTIYRLMNGGVYTTDARIENTADWPIQIEAMDLTTTEQANKPVITRVPNATGDYQPVIWASGDVTLKNLWIISGETGPGEQHNWGQVRFFGHKSKVIVEDCILEKDRGGFLQFRADSCRVYVNNCIFRNGGNRFILEGNGRGIDSRNFAMDTLIVRNTVMHNIVDRVFRSLGNVIPHNYIEFDHCTIFNQFGRHGGIVLEQCHNFVFTNNLWINPNMLGASPRYADEQNNPDNEVNKLFTLDTIVDPTNVTIANNNIFWTQDVKDIWAQHDTVSQPPVYSTLIQQAMGDTTGGYFSEEVELHNVPVRITEYLEDLLANPAAEDMFDVIVQDITAAGTPRDFGNLFDFVGFADGEGDFDPCYDLEGTESSTGGTDGGPIGVLTFCDLSTSVFEKTIDLNLSLELAPNPVTSFALFQYTLDYPSQVQLNIYDMMGREISRLVDGPQPEGHQTIEWNRSANLNSGLYIARLITEQGQMSLKISVQ